MKLDYSITSRFHVSGPNLCFGDRILGPYTELYLDSREAETPGFTRLSDMPARVDIVTAFNGKTIGFESKKPEDLLTSVSSRRLARQLKTLLEVVDVPVLLVRGNTAAIETRRDGKTYRYNMNSPLGDINAPAMNFRSLWFLQLELLSWQAQGAFVLPAEGVADSQLAEYIAYMLPVLAGTNRALTAVGGTDRRPPTERRPGWLLRRIPGIGGASSVKAHSMQGSTYNVLRAVHWGDDESTGLNKRQIAAIKEALE